MTFDQREADECQRLLALGLAEDLGDAGDITSQAIIPADHVSRAVVVPRSAGVAAGLQAAELIARMFDENLRVDRLAEDGPCQARQPLIRIVGPTRSILAIERTLLNMLGRLGGVATLTARYVQEIAGTKARILDTRKTTPGWRYLEKFAVRVGGGSNHRVGLFDAVLIKDNHLAELGRHSVTPVRDSVRQARQSVPAGTVVEVEVDSLEQLQEALTETPDIVLLDNMTAEMMRRAVALRDERAPSVLLEASGGVRLDTVRARAETGVDRISVGALTHSAPCLDVGLDDEPAP